MFDLKAQLLAKGLVSQEQVDRAKQIAKEPAPDVSSRERQKAQEQLKSLPKGEQYALIRKWVDRNRLDNPLDDLSACEKFFITGHDNQVSWLSIRPDLTARISTGQAGVIAYMSNHGLAHAVVPRDIAEDVAMVFPDWLKVLNDSN